MDKFINYFKDYFKDRSVGFYIALGTAVLTIITAIIYAATLGHLGGQYMSGAAIALLITGSVIFLAASLFRCARVGASVMAALSFVSLMLYAGTIYAWPISQAMVGFSELPAIIICAVLMFVCVIVANVCAWLRMQKKGDKQPTNKGDCYETNA